MAIQSDLTTRSALRFGPPLRTLVPDSNKGWRMTETDDWMRPLARDHATKVAAVILHGKPALDRPFGEAWCRALECLRLTHTPVAWIPDRLRERLLPSLPGDTEVEKLTYALGCATPWVLFFTNSITDAETLGFDLPTNYSGLRLGRDAVADLYRWPLLPRGRIDAGGFMAENEDPPNDRSTTPLVLMRSLAGVQPADWVAYLEILDRPAESWLRHDRKLARRMARLIGDRLVSDAAA